MLTYIFSSIGKKQIAGISGFMLILMFVIPHFIGNMFFLFGPEAFNSYAEHLHMLGPVLKILEVVLLGFILTHVPFTILVLIQNRKARGVAYAIAPSSKDRSWATRTMPYTGVIIALFLVKHLLDFTFVDHDTLNTMVMGVDQGVYGMLVNAFLDIKVAAAYIVVMGAVGLHIGHAFSSFFQTIGFYHERYTAFIHRVSIGIAVLITSGFSSVPILVNVLYGSF
jgi:succinate dehydrogenase / fumarate reductase, cytochrome b subunit